MHDEDRIQSMQPNKGLSTDPEPATGRAPSSANVSPPYRFSSGSEQNDKAGCCNRARPARWTLLGVGGQQVFGDCFAERVLRRDRERGHLNRPSCSASFGLTFGSNTSEGSRPLANIASSCSFGPRISAPSTVGVTAVPNRRLAASRTARSTAECRRRIGSPDARRPGGASARSGPPGEATR